MRILNELTQCPMLLVTEAAMIVILAAVEWYLVGQARELCRGRARRPQSPKTVAPKAEDKKAA